MADIKQLQKDRQQLFTDLYEGRIPKRVPIMYNIGWEAAIQLAGHDLKQAQWDNSIVYDVYDKACSRLYGDLAPVAMTLRNPMHYQMLGAKAIIMSSSGQMQHPEIACLEPSEYDEFIQDPYKMMVDKLLPRLYKALDVSSGQKALTLGKAFKAYNDENVFYGATIGKIVEKYGYATIVTHGFGEAPFDFLADFLRSFSGINMDVRRMPDKVVEACEAITPHMIKLLVHMNPNPSILKKGFIPLHMAPYLNNKQFEKFYWPTFKKVVEAMVEAGQGVDLFVEHDWMRFIDYLADLPGRIRMRFEYGDPKIIKEKLQGKHIISGLYPLTLLKTATKEECIDKAKELIDILAPGGGYMFEFDKSALSMDDVNIDNLIAVTEYVRDHAIY
ncbi:Uroporphyrinogen decarboxylase (URO-D) [Anaerovirgula multivorans]|uniref:Uroporphyrinogen decarboxylase (URO-D) n=1 Tax=Anaerovirgula multivorans TaxID=312168 RepID=A0A239IWH4_9FIRM|nr:uroporphyrinogen decarboxylase family protein [Anaerovirgula multivorans]SNS97732.1 Uroporphyrinogen decarboxylase (URO-D) [Anaerovirgula multivorans]